MKIAVLHWHTSSVGGINSTLQALRQVALARGDKFHIYASDPQKTKRPSFILNRKKVRGGDTFITIDGYAPHHPTNWEASSKMLAHYDVVMTSFLCPHPTKDYGTDPLFLPLLKSIRDRGQRLVGYIHDAYWDTYREFGEMVLPLVEKTMVAQRAYGTPLVDAGYPVSPSYIPFTPLIPDGGPTPVRDRNLVAWMPQWKAIKGVHKFFAGLRGIVSPLSVELYGNGIEYYKMRLLPEWKQVVAEDYFAPQYSGEGFAKFFGCVDLTEVPGVLRRASYAPDFQGHSAKYEAYKNGSYNTTTIEALYYGARPVVHSNMLKSAIPAEFLIACSDPKEWPLQVRDIGRDGFNESHARQFVQDEHSAERLYDRIFNQTA